MASTATFYRQSIWMIGTTLSGGALLYVVHIPLARNLPPGEYSIFATLLQVIHLLMIPTLALQIIFTEECASSRSEAEKIQLVSIVAAVLARLFLFWVGFAVVTFLFRNQLSQMMGVNHPMAFWTTMLTGWSLLWLPILQGIMQGRENFKWLGWLAIINGVGRYAAVIGALYLFQGQIVAVMWAVWLGMMINLGVGIWQTADIWKWRRDTVMWRDWLRKAVPMTVTLGCSQVMFSADMVFVQALFKDRPELDTYGFAGTIGRGLIILTTPLVGVMFPKVVEADKVGQKTNAIRDAILSGAILGVGALVFCWIFPAELVRAQVWAGGGVNPALLPGDGAAGFL
jgi:O-antigen/teichoic acid export membrane protein